MLSDILPDRVLLKPLRYAVVNSSEQAGIAVAMVASSHFAALGSSLSEEVMVAAHPAAAAEKPHGAAVDLAAGVPAALVA